MKKTLLIIFSFFAIGISSHAQEIGVRFGDVTGGNTAVDFIFNTGEFNRLHADVSFGTGIGVDLLWDFMYLPIGDNGLHYYVGVGPYILLDDPTEIGGAGEIGLEYTLPNAPFSFSVDWRPNLSIVEETDMHFDGFGLNIRYVFGN